MYAIRYVPRAEGRGFHAEHVLLPLLAQLFLLSFESARVPADWKVAKITPLYKKGPMVDSTAIACWRLVAKYRLYANVIGSLLTNWFKIPDT